MSGVSFRYGKVKALDEITARFHSNAVAVLGPNGAGKSTLLRLLMSAARPDAGSFAVAGWHSDDRAGVSVFRQRLGVMPQGMRLFGGYTCREFLRYVAWLREVPSAQVEHAATRALEVVDLVDRADERVKRLSGGMRQRLGLAQAIVNNPRLLVLDEPTVGLDPGQRADFRRYLARVKDECLVVLATHLVDDAAAVSDEVLVLDEGSTRFVGSMRDFVGHPAGEAGFSSADVETAYLTLVRPSQ